MVMRTRADTGDSRIVRADRGVRSLRPRHFGSAHDIPPQIRGCRQAFPVLDDALHITFVRSGACGLSPGHSPAGWLKVTSSLDSAGRLTGTISDSSLFFGEFTRVLTS